MSSTRKKSQCASSNRRLSFSKIKPAGNTKGIGISSVQKNNKMLAKALQDAYSELNVYKKTLNESSKCMSQFKFARSKMLQMNSILKSFVQGFEEVLVILNFDDSGLFEGKPPIQSSRTFKDQMDKIADLTIFFEEPSVVQEVDSEPVVEGSKNEQVTKHAISNEESVKRIHSQDENISSSSTSIKPATEISKDVEEANSDEKSSQTTSPRKTSKVDSIKPVGSSQPEIETKIAEKTPASVILHKSQIPKVTRIPVCRVNKVKSNTLKFSSNKKLSNKQKCIKMGCENTDSDFSNKKTFEVKDNLNLEKFSDNNEKCVYSVDSLKDNECVIGEGILHQRKTFVKAQDISKDIPQSKDDSKETGMSHHRKTFVKALDVPKDAPQSQNDIEERVAHYHRKTFVKVPDVSKDEPQSKNDTKGTVISQNRKTFVKAPDISEDVPEPKNDTIETVMSHHRKTFVKAPDMSEDALSKNDSKGTVISQNRKTTVKATDMFEDALQSNNDTEEVMSHHRKTFVKAPNISEDAPLSKNDSKGTVLSQNKKTFVKATDMSEDALQSNNDTEEVVSHHRKTFVKAPDMFKNVPQSKNDTEETVISHYEKPFVEVTDVSKNVTHSNSSPVKKLIESSNKSKFQENVTVTSANSDPLTAATIIDNFNKNLTNDSDLSGTVETQENTQMFTKSDQQTATVPHEEFNKNLTIDSSTGVVEAQKCLEMLKNDPEISIQNLSKKISFAINSAKDTCTNKVAECSNDVLTDFCNEKKKVQAASTKEVKPKKKKGKKCEFPVNKNVEDFETEEKIAVDVLHIMKTVQCHDLTPQQDDTECEAITKKKNKRGQKRKIKSVKEKTSTEHNEDMISSVLNNSNSKRNKIKTQKRKLKKCAAEDSQDSPCHVSGKNTFTVQAEIHQPPSCVFLSDEKGNKVKKQKTEGTKNSVQNKNTKDIESANKENKQLNGAEDLQVYVVLKDFRKSHFIDDTKITSVKELTPVQPVRVPLLDNSLNIPQLPDKKFENVLVSEESGTDEFASGRRRNRKPVNYIEPSLNRKMRR